jgi:2-polyprenyl-3-methyl-5-hydroxy-6-metoxy-1,4-benzoquinol methylase
MSIQLAKMGYEVTGIDVDKTTIEFAKSLVKLPNLKFLNTSVEALGFEDNSIDALICSEVLEHVVDPDRFITKIAKFLKKEGIIIITVPNGRGPRELFVTRPFLFITRHFGFLVKSINFLKKMMGYHGTDQSKAENLDHLHFFTLRQIHKLAQKNGFEIVKKGKANFIENTFPTSLFTNRIYALRVWDNKVADYLPYFMVSGFFTVWKRKNVT